VDDDDFCSTDYTPILDLGDSGSTDLGNHSYLLISKHDNILLVSSGHNTGRSNRKDCVNGNTVHQILQDYQYLDKGGEGWLRYYTFKPDENKIEVRTYSPYLEKYMDKIYDKFDKFNLNYIEDCDVDVQAIKPPELPDLYFVEIKLIPQVTKYLDFEVSVFNKGFAPAEDTNFLIYINDKVVSTRNIDIIESSSGFTFYEYDIEIPPTINEIRIVLDEENKITEIDETNNEYTLSADV